ncbi:MAG: fibronectin type III domain-containing protein, partial [candidate division Zixibacteria bacterium]|nr:fibronectin type III domain-containing protein [candidate division Zixibacteria bacterium]
MKNKCLIVGLLMLFGVSSVWAQTEPPGADSTVVDSTALFPAAVSDLRVVDKPNDHGHAVIVTWETSADDGGGKNNVLRYEVFYSTSFEGPFDSVGTVPAGESTFEHIGSKEPSDKAFVADYTDLFYRIDAVTADPTIRTTSDVLGPVQCSGQWFNTGRIPVLVAVLIFGALTAFFVLSARRGRKLYVRPIGGIEAVDDAIGRATEMGRPILYVLGLGSAADVATIASFTILGRVAKRVAEYQTELIVPTYDPIVMSVAQEVVKSSYFDAGRPEDFKEDCVHFVTQSQFAYVAAVNGIMLRELPATCVYMGKFFAESLLLAETGSLAGSIQISGTDEIAQIPFFIVACDYTLIGEELYAASAYLGREPKLLGSLKAQDLAKAAFVVLAIVGLVAANFEWF